MPTEPAITKDDERPDDKTELRRLIRAIKFSQKHFLYFACCNQVPKQNELIAEIKKSLGAKKIKVIKFKKPVTDLLGEIQKLKINAECEAVFVQGLDYSISSDGKGAENALIYNLNISRDSFKRYLSVPLILWLPEYAIVKITRHAADFFSVRSGVFYFSNPPEKVTEQIFESLVLGLYGRSSLSFSEKLKQIETIESLLGEYRGLHIEKQDKKLERQLLSQLANFFISISDYRKAIEFNKQSLSIARKLKSRYYESADLSNLGNAYQGLGEYEKAIEYYDQSLKIGHNIDDEKGISTTIGNLGNAYHNLGEYEKAIEFHKKSLEIKQEIEDEQGESVNLAGIANAWYRLGRYQEAINYYRRSLEIKRRIDDIDGEGATLGNLGLVYYRLGEYQKAIDCYKQSLSISQNAGNRHSEAVNLINLGNVYLHTKNNMVACVYWKQSLLIFESIESPSANIVKKLIEKNSC